MNRIESPFGFHSTAEEVIGSLDLRGKRAIVTGGGSGIGAETVRVRAHAGTEVTLLVRTLNAGESVAAEIRRNTGNNLVPMLPWWICVTSPRYRPYDPLLAYAQSKTAVDLFAVTASFRWAKDGITANFLNPGAIKTNLQRHVGGALRSPPEFHKTIAQGAATSIFVATSPLLTGIGGRYFDNCKQAAPVEGRPKEVSQLSGVVAPYSLDPSNAERLWDLSLRHVTRL